MKFVLKVLASTFAVIVTAYLLPGVEVQDFMTAVLVALVMAFLNSVIKPMLIVLTIPVTILTLGFFLLVINALLIELAAYAVNGFAVDGFWWAVLFSLILSVFNSMFNGLNSDTNTKPEKY
ncbi:MAG: phage holin family protein [Salibacteraceae bacterium]